MEKRSYSQVEIAEKIAKLRHWRDNPTWSGRNAAKELEVLHGTLLGWRKELWEFLDDPKFAEASSGRFRIKGTKRKRKITSYKPRVLEYYDTCLREDGTATHADLLKYARNIPEFAEMKDGTQLSWISRFITRYKPSSKARQDGYISHADTGEDGGDDIVGVDSNTGAEVNENCNESVVREDERGRSKLSDINIPAEKLPAGKLPAEKLPAENLPEETVHVENMPNKNLPEQTLILENSPDENSAGETLTVEDLPDENATEEKASQKKVPAKNVLGKKVIHKKATSRTRTLRKMKHRDTIIYTAVHKLPGSNADGSIVRIPLQQQDLDSLLPGQWVSTPAIDCLVYDHMHRIDGLVYPLGSLFYSEIESAYYRHKEGAIMPEETTGKFNWHSHKYVLLHITGEDHYNFVIIENPQHPDKTILPRKLFTWSAWFGRYICCHQMVLGCREDKNEHQFFVRTAELCIHNKAAPSELAGLRSLYAALYGQGGGVCIRDKAKFAAGEHGILDFRVV